MRRRVTKKLMAVTMAIATTVSLVGCGNSSDTNVTSEDKLTQTAVAGEVQNAGTQADEGISEEELQAAKEHLCGEEIINSEDVENRMKRLFRLYSFNFEMETNDETVAQIRAITKNDILEVLPKLLNLEEKALVFYGPKINKSIKDKDFFKNEELINAIKHAKKNNHFAACLCNAYPYSSDDFPQRCYRGFPRRACIQQRFCS